MKRPFALVLARCSSLAPAILVAQQGVVPRRRRDGADLRHGHRPGRTAGAGPRRKQHFEILDNIKPQKIAFFRSDVQPVSVVVTLDMSGSMIMNIEPGEERGRGVRAASAAAGSRAHRPFDDKIMDSPMFTSQPRRTRPLPAHRNAVRQRHAPVGRRRREHVRALSKETARRVVLVLSDGDDTASKRRRDGVLARAQNDDLMIYAIGLRSQYRGGPGGSIVAARPDRGLKKVAEETGGGYFELTKTAELNSTFTRVADELHRQYVLGFTPEVLDNKVHKLDVQREGAGHDGACAQELRRGQGRAAPASGRGRRTRVETSWVAQASLSGHGRRAREPGARARSSRRSSAPARRRCRCTRPSRRWSGRLVTDLTRDDFEVFDNGRPQPITLFDNSIQPINIVVMLDMSGSMIGQHLPLLRSSAVQMFTRLLPADKARVGNFGDRITLSPKFTNDQDELIRALWLDLEPGGPTPLWARGRTPRCRRSRRLDGRRVVLVLSDGKDTGFRGAPVRRA